MRTKFLGAAIVVGLAAGALAAQLQPQPYCDRLESQIEANESFQGQVACFPGGSESEGRVGNRTEIRCTCHRSFNGTEATFRIRATGTS